MQELRLEHTLLANRYLIQERYHRSNYAEIFLALDQYSQGYVIVKALNLRLQDTLNLESAQKVRENFQRELITLKHLSHPHIIDDLDYGNARDANGLDFSYIVFEYMPGGTLLSLCNQRALELGEIIFYVRQMKEALRYAHDQGVIHRDIKPTNLLLSKDYSVVKIADFGIAKSVLEDLAEISRVGTTIYSPPEHNPDSQEGNDERLTPSADVYSLAKSIYTLKAGKQPREFKRRPITMLPDHLWAAPWAPDLLAILRKATANTVSERYQTVQEFWNEFSRLAQYLPEYQVAPVRREVRQPQQPKPGFTTVPDLVSRDRIEVTIPPVTPAEPDRPDLVVEPPRPPAPVKNREKMWPVLVIALVMAFALMITVVSVYTIWRVRHKTVAGETQQTWVIAGKDKEGKDIINVSLRGEPRDCSNGPFLAQLPVNSSVVVMEKRCEWMKVKIIQWNGAKPAEAPLEGWVHSKFVQTR
jgi:serine/threonine protein kinase